PPIRILPSSCTATERMAPMFVPAFNVGSSEPGCASLLGVARNPTTSRPGTNHVRRCRIVFIEETFEEFNHSVGVLRPFATAAIGLDLLCVLSGESHLI